MLRVALYLRDTPAAGMTPADQEYALHQFAVIGTWTIAGTYRDGRTPTRVRHPPALTALTRAARSGQIDAVAIASLAVIGRSVPDLIDFAATLSAGNVELIVLNDSAAGPGL